MKTGAQARRRTRAHPAHAIDRRLRDELGEKEYRLLLTRLAAGVKAAQLLAERAPELVAMTNGKKRMAKVSFSAEVPADVSMFFNELLATFSERDPAARVEIERRVLQLVKGNRTGERK